MDEKNLTDAEISAPKLRDVPDRPPGGGSNAGAAERIRELGGQGGRPVPGRWRLDDRHHRQLLPQDEEARGLLCPTCQPAAGLRRLGGPPRADGLPFDDETIKHILWLTYRGTPEDLQKFLEGLYANTPTPCKLAVGDGQLGRIISARDTVISQTATSRGGAMRQAAGAAHDLRLLQEAEGPAGLLRPMPDASAPSRSPAAATFRSRSTATRPCEKMGQLQQQYGVWPWASSPRWAGLPAASTTS